MSYEIKFTNFNDNGSLTVYDGTINQDTSIDIPGRNYRGYGVAIAESFLHILENFASPEEPRFPIEGQLWYDTASQDLKICDASKNFKSAGSVRKGSSEPTGGVLGDLWVDTDNQQLFLFNGAAWVLVGPTFSSGLKTGVVAETVLDSNNIQKVILQNYINDEIVSIFSTETFIPKVAIEGFGTIKAGINLSTKDFNSDGVADAKYWGTAEKAENLIIGTNIVASSKFLRSDIANITDYNITVRSDLGVSTGAEGQLRLNVDANQIGNITHATTGSAFDLRVNVQSSNTAESGIKTLFRADYTGRIGLGINNLAPEETVDVLGTSRFSDVMRLTSTENTINDATGALRVSGGVNIQKDLIIRGTTDFTGVLTVGNTTSTVGTAIKPRFNNIYDIGYVNPVDSNDKSIFRRIYATNFYGNFVGDITGNVTGDVNGSANQLKSSTTFQITGDVTSPIVTFDGASGGLIKPFNTTISPEFIDSKPEFTTVSGDDRLLLYRAGTGLGKMYRTTFFTQIATVPIGTLLPFAGTTVPPGYLLCDGSEKSRTAYSELFAVIGYTYGNVQQLSGNNTFRLPDLRGRFPMGRNSMDNGDSIERPSGAIIDSNTQAIDSNTQATEDTAGVIGNVNGSQEISLGITNLPNHRHDLKVNGVQYWTVNDSTSTPSDVNAQVSNISNTVSSGQQYGTTGDMISTTTGTSFNIMNPYLTINYIIFTGKFS